MGRLAVVDSSVLIAFLDPDDAHHKAARTALSRGEAELAVPATVFAEVLVRPRRIGEGEAARIERFFDELPIEVRPVDREIAGIAARVRAESGLRLADALVVATAEALGAESVLTADLRWRDVDPRIEIIR